MMTRMNMLKLKLKIRMNTLKLKLKDQMIPDFIQLQLPVPQCSRVRGPVAVPRLRLPSHCIL